MTGEPVAFFTAEDPRELPKGSRDPLRFLPEWTAVGREMIPTLTTVTPSYRGFMTRFLFHGALEAVWPELARASSTRQWQAFCRFEQLCAIVRTHSVVSTPHLPGKTGVPDRDEAKRYTLGDASKYWLGRSQRNTGFWGYYHQALIGGGVLATNQADQPGYQLTANAAGYWQESRWPALLDSLQASLEPVIDPRGRFKTTQIHLEDWDTLAEAFARKPFDDPQGLDREFWSSRILWPSNSEGEILAAREFAEGVRTAVLATPDQPWSAAWSLLASGQASTRVAEHAQRVCSSEAVIGLCEWVFNQCRAANPEMPDLQSVAARAEDEFGFSDWLRRILAYGEPPRPELASLREVVVGSSAPFVDLSRVLLSRHDLIMKSRKSAPWVVLTHGDHLDVREPAKADTLPSADTPLIWRYDYFLNAWISAAKELGYLPETEKG